MTPVSRTTTSPEPPSSARAKARPYRCLRCEATFKRPAHLRRHETSRASTPYRVWPLPAYTPTTATAIAIARAWLTALQIPAPRLSHAQDARWSPPEKMSFSAMPASYTVGATTPTSTLVSKRPLATARKETRIASLSPTTQPQIPLPRKRIRAEFKPEPRPRA
jgi:hypothetical protein